MKKPAFAALAALLLLSAAAYAQDSWDKLEGQHSRIAERRAVAVTDKAAWEKVWSEHAEGAPLPAVDFNAESVVAVFLGETQTAGVKIEFVVQNDMIDSNRVNVFYKEIRSATKPFAATMVCRPFAFVKVRKAAVVSIEAERRVSLPEKVGAPKNPRDDSKFRALLATLPSFDGR